MFVSCASLWYALCVAQLVLSTCPFVCFVVCCVFCCVFCSVCWQVCLLLCVAHPLCVEHLLSRSVACHRAGSAHSMELCIMFWMFMLLNVIVLVVPTRCWLVFFSVIQYELLRRPVWGWN
jgi:hypothetical protein